MGLGLVESGKMPKPLTDLLNLSRKYSIWVYQWGLACCAIEMGAAFASPRYDVMRLGVIPLPAGPRQTDLVVISGTVTDKMAPSIRRLYEQMPDPKYVISMGSCANCGGPYWDSYSVTKGVDQIIPVDVYVPGCPPRPEALLEGIVLLQERIQNEDMADRWRGEPIVVGDDGRRHHHRRRSRRRPKTRPRARRAVERDEALARSSSGASPTCWATPSRAATSSPGRTSGSASSRPTPGAPPPTSPATAWAAKYFGFLSAIDWMPSPFGRSMDAEVDRVMAGESGFSADGEIEQGYAGGATRFQVFARIAHIGDPGNTWGVTLKADLPDEAPAIESWTSIYAGADWHEREAWEMFGIDFVGHPGLRHMYLPGAFEGHPLRKDFPLVARQVKPWPGIVDVEQMPSDDEDDDEMPADGPNSAEGGDS